MAGFNRVILMGNLTQDPELRYTPQGTAVTDLRLAVTTVRSGGKGGDKKEETLFIDVTVWDRMAENCCEYLAKGRPVLVEGRLVTDTWDDKEGRKQYKTRVMANTVQFIGGGQGGSREGGERPAGRSAGGQGGGQGGGQSGGQGGGRGARPAGPRQGGGSAPSETFRDDDFGSDDIPF